MTKEAQRAELHKTIWRIANDLRGSVDGWDFKTYVLGMLFYRFISENLTAYLNEQERKAGDAGLRLRDARATRTPSSGARETVAEKGFYILPSELFANVRATRHGTTRTSTRRSRGSSRTSRAPRSAAASEDDLKGLFDDLDVNSSKLGPTVAKRNEKLVKLLDASTAGRSRAGRPDAPRPRTPASRCLGSKAAHRARTVPVIAAVLTTVARRSTGARRGSAAARRR